MPGVLAQDPGGREAWLDVHGYATDTALWLAREVIETAWARGCRSIVVVHGAKHIETPAASERTGRGHTKWALRSALKAGEYGGYAWPAGSGEGASRVHGDRMELALRPNPSPDRDAAWPVPPPRDYE